MEIMARRLSVAGLGVGIKTAMPLSRSTYSKAEAERLAGCLPNKVALGCEITGPSASSPSEA
jgi:hypothetical protein